MLAPLIVAAVEARGTYRAVVLTPSPATGQVRLETEILRLQQEFLGAPSRVRFTLRAQLVESATRRVVASREFEAVTVAPSENPRGGVTAAHESVRKVLGELADFCVQNAPAVAAR
jgi:cholesterol transport system auxiliary component